MPNVVPNAPARPSVVAVPGQVTVTFVAPSNTGTAITSYTATCTSSNGGVTGHHAGATSPIVVSSLTNGKTYMCTVHATNIVGSMCVGRHYTGERRADIESLLPLDPALPSHLIGVVIRERDEHVAARKFEAN